MGFNDQTELTEGSLQLALLMLSREFSGMIHNNYESATPIPFPTSNAPVRKTVYIN